MRRIDLGGRRVVVTRAAAQAGPLIDAIGHCGGIAIRMPLLRIAPPADGGLTLRSALAAMEADDWVAVTSTNGAHAVITAGLQRGRIATVGASTAEIFRRVAIEPDIVASPPRAEALAQAMAALPNVRVVVAQSDHARTTLVAELEKAGHTVRPVEAYRNLPVAAASGIIADAHTADAVIFASPSAIRRYVAQAGVRPRQAVCIGPTTAKEGASAGFDVVEAAAPDVASLMHALESLSRPDPMM